MRILYIDTTTSYLYTGIVVDGKLIAEVKENLGKDLSSFALKKISNLLSTNQLEPEDIDKIMVVSGPGSFTGIRVGITIAKTYAYSLKKEILTISSLEAMALSVNNNKKFKIPVIDARRNYVYAAIYDNNLNLVLKEQYISLEALKCAVDNLIDDYEYISNEKFDNLEISSYNPNIEKIVNTLSNRKGINPHAVNPIYLKLTEAEEKQDTEIL